MKSSTATTFPPPPGGVNLLKIFNELDLIAWIKAHHSGKSRDIILGIGDDCAAVKPARGKIMLVTTDTLAEGVHFLRESAPPRLLGGKCAAVNLSDIAAMGGQPKYALLSPCFPKGLDRKWIKDFLRGFHETLSQCGCILIGGNVSSAKDWISVTVTVMGQIAEKRIVKRDGAKPGDLIYITGTPGDSALGLDLLLSGRKPLNKAEKYLVSRHLSPTPRVEWGMLIAETGMASAMIDVSDGLALDLLRLVEASKVCANVSLDSIPLSVPATKMLADMERDDGWRRILNGGEDYELLFTVHPKKESLLKKLIGSGKIVASKIGHVTDGAKPKINFSYSSGQTLKVSEYGYVHF
jgi:thiamine-monophosphate kinase